MNKRLLLISFVLISLLLVTTVSALEFDNAIRYDPIKDEITIKNWLGLGEDLAKVQLQYNDAKCGVECKAIWNVTILNDMDDFLSSMEFKQVDGSTKYLEHRFEYISSYETKVVDIKEADCNNKITSPDGSKQCSTVITGQQEEQVPIWSEFNPKQRISPGNYIIKLIGIKEAKESIDWIPTFYGKEAKMWAWWVGTQPLGYWNFNEAPGSGTAADTSGNGNTITVGANEDFFTGKLGNALGTTSGWSLSSDGLTSFNFSTNSFTIAFWVNSTSNPSGLEALISTADGWIEAEKMIIGWNGGTSNNIKFVTGAPTIHLYGPDLTLNNWYRIVITRDNTTITNNLKMYVNGTFFNQTDFSNGGSIYNFPKPILCLGNTCDAASAGAGGHSLDDLQIYDIIWTSADVTNDYNNGVGIEANGTIVADPVVQLNSPADLTTSLNDFQTFNCSSNDTQTNSGILNLSLWIDGTLNVSLLNSTANANLSLQTVVNGLSIIAHDWTCDTYDIDGNHIWATSNRTLTISEFQENNQTFNATSYETSPESFNLNITYNITTFTSSSAILNYNGSTFTGTSTGTGNNRIFTYDFGSLPTSDLGNRTFWWQIDLTNSSGSNYFNSTFKNQTVNALIFNQCNASNNVVFTNITFKDESSLARINGSIVTSTWNYWLGDGSVSKQLIYTNSSQDFNEYDFCSSAADKILKNNETIDYSLTGYPQRTVDFNDLLTNTTSDGNRTLYLLASADGIYVTFTFTDDFGTIQSGADVFVERSFSGTFTHILDAVTDDAGTATFWLDPDETYRLTFTKTGCTTKAYTVVPSLNTYTVTTDCTGGSEGESGPTHTDVYSSYIDGISWLKTPNNGVHRAGHQNFSYYVYARDNNLVGAKFEIVDLNNVILNSSTVTIGSGCSISSCSINLSLVTSNDNALKGKYYVQTTNSSGYILIEADAYWKFIDYRTNATGTLNKFIVNFRNAFSEWSSDSPCAYVSNVTCVADTSCKWVEPDNYIESLGKGTCIPNDEKNRAEFSRILFFFLFFSMLYAFLNKMLGFDNQSPGIIIWVLTGFVMVMSFAGGITGPGFFYYDGLFGHSSNAAEFLNNWILAMLMICLSIGYFATASRRNS